MDIAKSEGRYTIEEMQQMATIASSADGLFVSGNNFKVGALIGSHDMLLFALEELIKAREMINNIENCLVCAAIDDPFTVAETALGMIQGKAT